MNKMDTSIEINRIWITILSRMMPEQRFTAALSLTQTCKLLLAEGVKRRHAEYTENQIRLAVIKLLLGEELFSAVYPEEKDIKP